MTDQFIREMFETFATFHAPEALERLARRGDFDKHILDAVQEPFPFLHRTESHVVVSVAWEFEDVFEAMGATALTPPDRDGAKLMSVPVSAVRKFHTDEEAETIMRCLEIDHDMLANAR